MEYDALLVAVGARQVEAYQHVATFHDADADAAYHGIVQDVEGGYSRRLAFIQPVGPVWPLPLYELALMTAERADSMDIRDLELVLVTPEPRPLAVFGTAVSDAVTSRLARAGIKVYCNSLAKVPAARQLAHRAAGRRAAGPADRHDAARRRPCDPRASGAGAHGFVPIDKHCAVPGTGGRVFAAGDAANYPIKHGGLGAQMADAAAAAIADLAGRSDERARVQPGDPRQAADRRGSGLHERAPGRGRELRVGGLRLAAMAGRREGRRGGARPVPRGARRRTTPGQLR